MHLKLGTADQGQGLRTRLRDKLLRRNSGSPSPSTKSGDDSTKRTGTASSIRTHDSGRPCSSTTTTGQDNAGSKHEAHANNAAGQASPRSVATRSWALTVDDDGSETTARTQSTPLVGSASIDDKLEVAEDLDGDNGSVVVVVDDGDGRVPGRGPQHQDGATGVTAAALGSDLRQQPQHHHLASPQQQQPPTAGEPPQPPPPPPPSQLQSSTSTTADPTTSLPSIDEHPAGPRAQTQQQPPLAGAPVPAPIVISLATPSTPSTPNTPIHSRRGISLNDPNDDDSALKTSPQRSLTTSALSDSPLAASPSRPSELVRRQSIVPYRQQALIKTLLTSDHAGDIGYSGPVINGTMVTRKIWVKRPLASATLVTVTEEDLVDDVRDMILRKYANSLGRQFDAPDLVIRLCSREQQQPSRMLQPDEPICRIIDATYPGGQTVEEALLIDIPSRRTPKASPNPRFYSDDRPHESGTDYFPPYPPAPGGHHNPSHLLTTAVNGIHFPPSMGVVNGNALPPLPSPGSVRRLAARPKMTRVHTASPIANVVNGTSSHPPQSGALPATSQYTYTTRPVRSRTHSGASSDHSAHPAPAPAIPSPPAPERTATPPPRVSSPRPTASARSRKSKKPEKPPLQASLPSGLLNGGVPPINVLIVEDNIINLKLLEAFVKRLKVRWQTAMNGRDAVTKWRTGGFHLVLMDIQLPIMNGLDATREIRRLEKVNSIGVFSSSASSAPEENQNEPDEGDKLSNTEMFKSPVIIVALTASSLQSDRHEALAAGCNDFLTKPVNFVWLERKVMEWGCMQALIDFDGWRKWKDFSQKAEEAEAAKKAASAKAKAKKNRLSSPVAA